MSPILQLHGDLRSVAKQEIKEDSVNTLVRRLIQIFYLAVIVTYIFPKKQTFFIKIWSFLNISRANFAQELLTNKNNKYEKNFNDGYGSLRTL